MDTSHRGNHSNLTSNQFTSECRQLIKLVLRPAVFDCDVLALDQAAVLEALTKCAEQMRVGGGRCAVEEADDRHRCLLRTRRERPCGRAAEKADEVAPVHSITSSAVICMISGTVRPSAFAVLRLTASSNFTVCWTGRSAGCSPLSIRPT